jgi:hypothetical protein
MYSAITNNLYGSSYSGENPNVVFTINSTSTAFFYMYNSSLIIENFRIIYTYRLLYTTSPDNSSKINITNCVIQRGVSGPSTDYFLYIYFGALIIFKSLFFVIFFENMFALDCRVIPGLTNFTSGIHYNYGTTTQIYENTTFTDLITTSSSNAGFLFYIYSSGYLQDLRILNCLVSNISLPMSSTSGGLVYGYVTTTHNISIQVFFFFFFILKTSS